MFHNKVLHKMPYCGLQLAFFYVSLDIVIAILSVCWILATIQSWLSVDDSKAPWNLPVSCFIVQYCSMRWSVIPELLIRSSSSCVHGKASPLSRYSWKACSVFSLSTSHGWCKRSVSQVNIVPCTLAKMSPHTCWHLFWPFWSCYGLGVFGELGSRCNCVLPLNLPPVIIHCESNCHYFF